MKKMHGSGAYAVKKWSEVGWQIDAHPFHRPVHCDLVLDKVLVGWLVLRTEYCLVVATVPTVRHSIGKSIP